MVMDEKLKFGEITAKDLNIGDIVEWSRWCSESEDWILHYGIITEMKNEIRSNRLVSISKVMPLSGDQNEIEFFSMSLRRVSPPINLENKQ
jgi:hypothetical protein